MDRKTPWRRQGFSLIELVIIFFIIATLLLLVVGLFTRSCDLARTLGCVTNVKQIAMAIENYQTDWKSSPEQLADLVPVYLPSAMALHCPADRGDGNTYDADYLARVFSEEDANKVFLVCNRHSWQRRAVVGYLSYAAGATDLSRFMWQGIPASFRTQYTSGELSFADGTSVSILEGAVGVLSSFRDISGRQYTILYVPDRQESSTATRIEVRHNGDSRFEIVDPCVIAGVAGTRFQFQTIWDPHSVTSSVNVGQGAVILTLRGEPMRLTASPADGVITVDGSRSESGGAAQTPGKPPKRAKVTGVKRK